MTPSLPPPAPTRAGWLNRSTLGVALASLFSDISHELATAVLPAVLLALGAGPAALGLIEGSADGISTLAKLWGGAAADKAKRRKPLAAVGYLVTAAGIATIAFCTTWTQVMACRVAAWIGRGSRSAPRDVLMAEATAPEALGKAFGMERAADAFGAVLGPLLAVALIARGQAPQHVLLWSLAPGLLAFLSIALIVKEKPRAEGDMTKTSFLANVRSTGKPFQRLLIAVFAFGCGDFSRTLLILYVIQHSVGTLFSLSAGALAIALYVLHNAVSALASFPLGALTDRIGRQPVLIGGYFLAGATTLGFALLPASPVILAILFIGSGVYIACEEVAEKASAAQLLPAAVKGTGMGVLAATNGLGDFVSSAMVGLLWSAFPTTPAIGFGVAAALQLAGGGILAAQNRGSSSGAPSS
ncbi:MAG TPA: MFS transporter [Thermoanaerobaculia bacterium]|jgi:MFS family permease|nr:MFS transporter [Thermoanaerobaculia bacterium]